MVEDRSNNGAPLRLALKTLKRVGVVVGGNEVETPRLFRALSDHFPIEFVPLTHIGGSGLDGLVLLNSDRETARRMAESGLPTLAFCSRDGDHATAGTPVVEFADSCVVPLPLRGQQLWEGDAGPWPSLVPEAGETVVCTKGGANIWLRRTHGEAFYSLTSVPLPDVAAGAFLQPHFRAGRFMGLLPLLSFLKEVSADGVWRSAPPRACFVFDDPSLWSRSYGFIDFARLAEHARRHGYHVAIATIPLGSAFARRATVSLFREYADSLSLIIHGNNHSFRELGQDSQRTAPTGILAQTLQRVERFEQKFGARVCRVMEPPHGLWRKECLPALHFLGFDGILGTTELLLGNHEQGELPAVLGLGAADMVPGAAPLLPRIRLTPAWRTDVLLAAFLGRPIIVAGHHQDLAEGLGFLEDLAATVGRLPDARWMNPSDILLSSFETSREEDLLRLRMFSRKIHVRVPADTRRVVVERPWLTADGREELRVDWCAGGDPQIIGAAAISDPIPVNGSDELEITSSTGAPLRWQTVPRPRTPLIGIVRRALMEIRDRSYPWRYRYRWLRREPPLRVGY